MKLSSVKPTNELLLSGMRLIVESRQLAESKPSTTLDSLTTENAKLKLAVAKLSKELENFINPKKDTFDITFKSETLSSLSRTYDKQFFKDYTEDCCFKIAISLCNWCSDNNVTPVDLWQDLVSKNGKLEN